MKVKIISDGTSKGSKLLTEDGREIEMVQAVTWTPDCRSSKIATVTATILSVPVELEGHLEESMKSRAEVPAHELACVTIRQNLNGCFGMMEMEDAARCILDKIGNDPAIPIVHRDMTSEEAMVGLLELLHRGWLRRGTHNGTFHVTRHFIDRVKE